MATFSTPITPVCTVPGAAVWRVRRSTVLLAGTFGLVWAASLSRSVFDPIGYDQALYQYITQRVMAGDRMYIDVWDQNAPGIVAIHWFSTRLVGGSPMALRLFDAAWQLLTLAALVALAARDGGRWRLGWLAATLYALGYYGLGYVHTAQREGFAALPLLLMLHATLPTAQPADRFTWSVIRHFIGGVLGFIVFVIKPPLGLCFGVPWLLALRDIRGRQQRPCNVLPLPSHSDQSLAACCRWAALSAGFALSAAAFVALMMHLDWWEGFWPVLTRREVAGYVRGPGLARELAPSVFAAAAVIGVVLWLVNTKTSAAPSERLANWGRSCAAGLVVFGLLASLQRWADWQQTFPRVAGLLVPACGAVLIGGWQGRSQTWKNVALLAGACFAAIAWQGQFYLYHFPPLLALAAYLVANELLEGLSAVHSASGSSRLWTAVCVGCVAHLLVGVWGWTMTFHTRSPYVLAGTTIEDHYTRVTRHKTHFPPYATTAKAARRVQILTQADEPIACLIDEPRLYYLSERPAVYPLLRTQDCYRDKFAGLLRVISDRRPKVVLARMPEALRGASKPLVVTDEAVRAAVFRDLEAYFGPPALDLADLYQIAEIIDNDICILQPRTGG